MAESMTYTVDYRRDEQGWWVASVPEVPGALTQGRTIRQARKRIREALSFFVNDAATATLRERFVMPVAVSHALSLCREARRRADEEASRARLIASEAAVILTHDWALSVRDAGELLELSHQRVQQLVTATLGLATPAAPFTPLAMGQTIVYSASNFSLPVVATPRAASEGTPFHLVHAGPDQHVQ